MFYRHIKSMIQYYSASVVDFWLWQLLEVGPSGELPPADIPTNRNVLTKILLVKESGKSE